MTPWDLDAHKTGFQNQGDFYASREDCKLGFEPYEKTAILVDEAFYRRRAFYLFGDKNPQQRAHELVEYCCRHLKDTTGDRQNSLYRIFYCDCPPMEENLYHPFLGKPINMGKTEQHKWTVDFFAELANKRKVALRMGTLQERESAFRIRDKSMKKLCRGEMALEELRESDFEPNFVQKGVDMRIGLDIASMAYKHQVTQIVLIAGDSDFVPAAKHARREGIDFILDPMWQGIRPELNEHVDGLHSCTFREPSPESEELHVDYKQKQKKNRHSAPAKNARATGKIPPEAAKPKK